MVKKLRSLSTSGKAVYSDSALDWYKIALRPLSERQPILQRAHRRVLLLCPTCPMISQTKFLQPPRLTLGDRINFRHRLVSQLCAGFAQCGMCDDTLFGQ